MRVARSQRKTSFLREFCKNRFFLFLIRDLTLLLLGCGELAPLKSYVNAENRLY